MAETIPTDLVVTVPMNLWLCWLAEGDLPGDPPEESGLWDFYTGRAPQYAAPGSRVYVVAHGHLRGYAPLLRVEDASLVRGGGAEACTILVPETLTSMPIPGFRGVRKRWWKREEEVPFPDWATHGLPPKLAADAHTLLRLRQDPVARKAIQQRALAGGRKPTIGDLIDAANDAKMRARERAADAEMAMGDVR